MKPILTIAIVILAVLVVGTVGFDSYNEYREKRDLNNFIVSCMEQFGEEDVELIDCLNGNPSPIP